MLLIQVFAVGINPELDFASKKWIEGCNVNPRMGSSGVPVANCVVQGYRSSPPTWKKFNGWDDLVMQGEKEEMTDHVKYWHFNRQTRSPQALTVTWVL